MTHEATAAEVRNHLAADPQYPLGEPSAMKWAIAFRLIREKRGLADTAPDDGDMVGWFANAMATQEVISSGGSLLNADGAQSIIDGEMEPHPEFHR